MRVRRIGFGLGLGIAGACGAPVGAPSPTHVEPTADVVMVGCGPAAEGECGRPQPGASARCEGMRRAETPRGFTVAVWWPGGGPGDALVAEDLRGHAVARAESVAFEDGARVELIVPEDATALTLRRGESAVRRWTLRDPGDEPAGLAEARAGLTGPDPAQAAATLQRALPGLGDAHGTAALDVLADLQFRTAEAAAPGQRDAAWRDALATTRQAHARAQARRDELRARCHARRGLFVSLERTHDGSELETWRAQVQAPSPTASAGADAYTRGLLALRVGDVQAAATEFAAAERGAERLSDRPLGAAAAQQLANVLATLGRGDEADAASWRASTAAAAIECRPWLHMLNNTGWSRVVSREQGRSEDDPVPDLNDALTVLEAARSGDACDDPRLAAHVRLGLALAAADEGWWGWATQLRDALPAKDDGPADLAPWRDELDRRLALVVGDRGALVEWSLSHAREPAPARPDAAWAWAWGRGRVAEALGDTDGALVAYAAADDATGAMMLQLDFDFGRDALLRGRQRSAARQVALLHRRGRDDAAMCVARRARARTSHVLDRAARIATLSDEGRARWTAAIARHAQLQRETDALRENAWSIPLDRRAAHEHAIARGEDALRGAARDAAALLAENATAPECSERPEPGALWLMYFPLDGGTWLGFAADEGGVVAHALGRLPPLDGPPQALAAALLPPFAKQLDRATMLRILPTGPLWTVPFAALPWRGDTLLAAVPVEIGLDLPAVPEPPAASNVALVIGDPRGDLPAAVAEAQVVDASLRRAGWDASLLLDHAASADAARRTLPEVDLLHFAGHGEHQGLEGWRSALQLAAGGRLDVTDVLALPSVPRTVVLPACDTAPSQRATLGGDMNVARAFLLAGAQAVIATQGPVDDALAARVGAGLYAAGPPVAPSTASRLREVLLSVRHDDALPLDVRAQWSRIVVMVR